MSDLHEIIQAMRLERRSSAPSLNDAQAKLREHVADIIATPGYMSLAQADALTDALISGPIAEMQAEHQAEVEGLKAHIVMLGDVAGICSFHILGTVCDNCRCERSRRTLSENGGGDHG